MRLLPDRPSIEFLRKEAKDLLAVLRESKPDTSLAEAQRVLAGEYGERDWPALKAEVERRVADAPAAPAGLAEELAAAFGLGKVTAPARPVTFTAMGRCWDITTDHGRWLAVTVYQWITNEQAELGARLRDAAVAAGLSAPVPARSPNGRLIESVRGESWRVHEWLEVGPSPMLAVSAELARRAGALFATLHGLAIPSEEPIHWYLTRRRSYDEWQELLGRARAADKPWAEKLDALLPTIWELQEIELEAPDQLVLCNRNLIPTHVRQGRDGELVAMEWDFAGSLTPELEIGSALTQWVLRPDLNVKALQAFRDGYGAVRAWPRLDMRSFAVGISGWLNWSYNAVCEAINPGSAELAVFAEREAVGVLDRPMTCKGLEQLLV
ncbi:MULTISPECIES: aminoglycoside phosphotransferase [Kribbella]|uniref:Aminoglycoside phosphotransferase domain-containing protein n=1 Tax=Kribbella karoonensis TaxID=324851 RepID=A0ABP4QCI1_9ACTN